MITRLTPEQESLIPVVRDEWIGRITSCAPLAPQAELEGHIAWLYGLAKRPPPRVVVARGPLDARRIAQESGRRDIVFSVSGVVWNTVGAAVGAAVGKGVNAIVNDAVRKGVRSAVGAAVGAAIWTAVGAASDNDWVGVPWETDLSDVGYGAWVDYWLRVGLPLPENASRFVASLKSNAWCLIVLDGLAVVSGAPEYLRLDSEGRPHSPDGPVARFRDGWTVYAWHGVRLGGELGRRIIEEPDSITREDFAGCGNAEVVRAMIERLGTDRYVQLLDFVEVHHERWGHPEVPEDLWEDATLLRQRSVDPVVGYRRQVVRVTCPTTGRVYHLRVPPTVTTAREAVAWTMDVPPADYLPVAHT